MFSHAGAKTAAFITNSMFATSASLTGNPGIEWTYCNGTPATNTLTHTHRSIKQSNNSMREKQVYDNISPSASPLALGSTGPGPDHSVLTYSIRLSVVSSPCCSPPTLALWLEESASRQLLLRAPTCGISTFRGGAGLYPTLMSQALLTQPLSSWDIYGFCWLHHLQIWRNLRRHLTECLGKISRVLFKIKK